MEDNGLVRSKLTAGRAIWMSLVTILALEIQKKSRRPEHRNSKVNFRYAFSRDPKHPFQNKSMLAPK